MDMYYYFLAAIVWDLPFGSPSSWFLCHFDVTLLVLKDFFTFLHLKMFQNCLVLSLL